jgi:sporulation protein YlmC with PRC-barrel domain
MLKIKRISEVLGKHVYTGEGEYFGQVEDVNLMDNKIDGWKIRVSSGFMSSLGGAKGVIIPQQFVKAIGDVFVVTKGSMPTRDDSMPMSSNSNPSSPGNSSNSMMMNGDSF